MSDNRPLDVIGFPANWPNARTITFGGATGENTINIPDNLADALIIQEGANKYISFVTTNSGEIIEFGKSLSFDAAATIDTSGNNALTLNAGTEPVIVHSSGGATKKLNGSDFEVQDNGIMVVFRDNANDASAASINYMREQSSGIVTDDATLGDLNFRGNDGVDNGTLGAAISADVNGTPAAQRIPTDLIFSTAEGAGDDDIAEKMRLTNDGDLIMGTSNTISDTNGNLTSANGADFGPSDISTITVVNGIVTAIAA